MATEVVFRSSAHHGISSRGVRNRLEGTRARICGDRFCRMSFAIELADSNQEEDWRGRGSRHARPCYNYGSKSTAPFEIRLLASEARRTTARGPNDYYRGAKFSSSVVLLTEETT